MTSVLPFKELRVKREDIFPYNPDNPQNWARLSKEKRLYALWCYLLIEGEGDVSEIMAKLQRDGYVNADEEWVDEG